MYTLCPKAAHLSPYTPAEGHYRIRMDANESFLLPTEADCETIGEVLSALPFNRYPDPLASAPVRAFSGLYGVDSGLVTAGNGSDELISLILSVFLQKGETVLTLEPDFSMYRFYTGITETPCVTLPKEDDLHIDVDAVLRAAERHKARALIFSNPCNPTSLGLSRDEVRELLRSVGDTLVVLDEAYMDFWDQSLLGEVERYDNLIILRTASKALGLAALRLGFAVANRRLTEVLRAAKSPYNVNAATQAAAAVLLQNPVYRETYVDVILTSRRQLSEGFLRLRERGMIHRLYDSHTNFVLIEIPNAPYVYRELLDFGIAVRLISETRLRITAGRESENRELLRAVASIARHREETGEGL